MLPKRRGSCILGAADSVGMCRLLNYAFGHIGFDVSLAQDGLHALAIARARQFDLVIVGWMGKFDGLELLSELRQLPQLESTPVLMISTGRDSEERKQMQELGLGDL